MKKIDNALLKQKLFGYFQLTDFLLPQQEAEDVIREGVSFRGINILILIVAIFIASLGLNTNSTAVIIGAMLISPLMGPIIGIGLAVGIHDFELMKRSFRNLFMATLFSIITSTIYFLISPVNEAHSELLARTSPTIYDIFIGFFGGAAGILAIGSKIKGNVIPGVAIATALMPPLCTVGYGLATMQPSYFLGAIYLFFINSVFIACATTLGVRLMNYKVVDFTNPARANKVRNIIYTIAVLTMIPAVYLTINMFRENNFLSNCSKFVDEQCEFTGTQVLNYKTHYSKKGSILTINLVGRPLPQDSLVLALTDMLPAYHLAGTKLNIVQGATPVTTADITKSTSTLLRDMYQATQSTIASQQEIIDSLRNNNAVIARNDSIGALLAPELKVIFPQVKDIAVTRAIVCDINSMELDTMNIALVNYSSHMGTAQTTKFKEYLEARLRLKDVTIIPSQSLVIGNQKK